MVHIYIQSKLDIRWAVYLGRIEPGSDAKIKWQMSLFSLSHIRALSSCFGWSLWVCPSPEYSGSFCFLFLLFSIEFKLMVLVSLTRALSLYTCRSCLQLSFTCPQHFLHLCSVWVPWFRCCCFNSKFGAPWCGGCSLFPIQTSCPTRTRKLPKLATWCSRCYGCLWSRLWIFLGCK